jgi:hypothetical protein
MKAFARPQRVLIATLLILLAPSAAVATVPVEQIPSLEVFEQRPWQSDQAPLWSTRAVLLSGIALTPPSCLAASLATRSTDPTLDRLSEVIAASLTGQGIPVWGESQRRRRWAAPRPSVTYSPSRAALTLALQWSY